MNFTMIGSYIGAIMTIPNHVLSVVSLDGIHTNTKARNSIIRYFVIFLSNQGLKDFTWKKETSKKMRWHKEENIDDGFM